MALTYLDSVMIEVPATIALLSTQSLSTDELYVKDLEVVNLLAQQINTNTLDANTINSSNLNSTTIVNTNLFNFGQSFQNVAQIASLQATQSLFSNSTILNAQIEQGNAQNFTVNDLTVNKIRKELANVLYVTMSGDDNNAGTNIFQSLRTIKKACEIAHNKRVENLNNPNARYTIFVSSGDYTELNPIYVPPNVSIIGDNLRRVTIRPYNPVDDILWVDNSAYVWGVTFRGHLGSSAATAFPNYSIPALTAVALSGLQAPYVSPGVYKWRKPYISTSPYIQGSSSITTGLSSALQNPATSAVQTFNSSSYPIAPDSTPFTDTLIDTIIEIVSLSSYTNITFTPPGDASIADTLLLNHKEYIQNKTIEYAATTFPLLSYDTDKCSRDVGFVLSAVRADLLAGNNDEAIINGLAYWNGVTNALPYSQRMPTINAFKHIKTLISYVLNGNYTDRDDVSDAFKTVTDIMAYGPGAAISYTKGVYPGALSAAQILNENTEYIQKETIAFVDRLYPTLSYDKEKCERDVGFILSAVRMDITTGNNNETIINGLAYYNGNNLYIPENQVLPTIAAINYAKRLALFVTKNTPVEGLNAGCGMRVDGSLVEGFLRSMVLDSYTQFNETGRGIHILNNGYAQLVSIFTICCSEGIICESGGVCSISNSNCSFGLSGVVATGKSPIPILSGTVVDTITSPEDINTTKIVVMSGIEGMLINPNSDYYPTLLTIPGINIDTRKIAYAPYDSLVFTLQNDTEAGTLYTITGSPTLTSINDNPHYIIEIIERTSIDTFTPGNPASFYLRSTAYASSHTFEFVGTGVVLREAIPALGGLATPETEVIFDNGGAVFYTSTNHTGDFNIGEEFRVVQSTGTIEGDTFKRSILTLVSPLNLAIAD